MKFDKPEISGLLVLFIGVGLLAFTFLNAYWLLSKDISIVSTQDLVKAFGEALAPLIGTVIHVMYLGIMGWIGSLLTLRGIPLLTHPKPIVTQPTQIKAPTTPVAEAKPIKKEEKAKEKPKPQEAEKPLQPPEKPKEEPKKEPEKKPEPIEPEKPGITIEVRPPEEVTVETPQKPSTTPQPSQSPQQ